MQSLKLSSPVQLNKSVSLAPAAKSVKARIPKVQYRSNNYSSNCTPQRYYNQGFWQQSPFVQLSSLLDGFDRQLNQELQAAVDFHIRLEVEEKEDKYVVFADIPGVNKEDVKVQLNKNILTVSGEKKSQKKWERSKEIVADNKSSKDESQKDGPEQQDTTKQEINQEKEANVAQQKQEPQSLVFERLYGKFQRVFKFKKDVDASQVSAKLENGVLQLEVPKVTKDESAVNINIQ